MESQSQAKSLSPSGNVSKHPEVQLAPLLPSPQLLQNSHQVPGSEPITAVDQQEITNFVDSFIANNEMLQAMNGLSRATEVIPPTAVQNVQFLFPGPFENTPRHSLLPYGSAHISGQNAGSSLQPVETALGAVSNEHKRESEPQPAVPKSTKTNGKKSGKRKPRTYTQAKASKHCHICSRKSTPASPPAVCGNLQKGTCRKTVCTKCFLQFGWDLNAARGAPLGTWECPHCRQECPQRAQCVIYNRTSERRRLNLINHRKRKVDGEQADTARDGPASKRQATAPAPSIPDSGNNGAPRIQATSPVAGHSHGGGAPLEGASHGQQGAGSSRPNAEQQLAPNEQEAGCHNGSEGGSGIKRKPESGSEVGAGASLKRSRLSEPPLEFSDLDSRLPPELPPLEMGSDLPQDPDCFDGIETPDPFEVDLSPNILFGEVPHAGEGMEGMSPGLPTHYECLLEEVGTGSGDLVPTSSGATEGTGNWCADSVLNEFQLDGATAASDTKGFDALL